MNTNSATTKDGKPANVKYEHEEGIALPYSNS